MASEAPSWADQWGAGGFGAMDDEGMRSQKDTAKKKGDKGGLAAKAKARAMEGVQKIKSATTCCVKWVKHQFKGNSASK